VVEQESVELEIEQCLNKIVEEKGKIM